MQSNPEQRSKMMLTTIIAVHSQAVTGTETKQGVKRLAEVVLQVDSDTSARRSNDAMPLKELEFTARTNLVEDSTWCGLNANYVPGDESGG